MSKKKQSNNQAHQEIQETRKKQENRSIPKKKYRVLKAPIPLVVQDKVLITGGNVELKETPQVLALVEQKILKEV